MTTLVAPATYTEFLASKVPADPATGLAVVPALNPALKDFQRAIVGWALRRGRALLAEDCGLGKAFQGLEWARVVSEHAQGPVMILTPLAVAQQTVREGEKFGIPAVFAQHRDRVPAGANLVVTNYERLHHFDPAAYAGVVLDEASCIKSHDAQFRAFVTEAFAQTAFRLECTATPAPNDFMELGTHAEFLGVMTRAEMLATFFVHDGGDVQQWRLKGHAEQDFWRWLASWAVMLRSPGDLGFDASGYDLPPLTVRHHVVETPPVPGELFATQAESLAERITARRESVAERVARTAAVVNAEPGPWVVWCNLNAESQALVKAIPGAVELTGSESPDMKELKLRWFIGDACICQHLKKSANTCASGRNGTANAPANTSALGPLNATPDDGSDTRQTPNTANNSRPPRATSRATTRPSNTHSDSAPTDSRATTTSASSRNKEADARYVADLSLSTTLPEHPQLESAGSTSTIATTAAKSEDCSVRPAISDSGSSKTTLIESSEPPCTCGYTDPTRRILVSKGSIAGFGSNWQHCARTAFVGLTDSWETYYQCVRRFWRFGQTAPVTVHLIAADTEGNVVQNIERKERDAERMAAAMVEHMADLTRAELGGMSRDTADYAREVASGDGWTLHLADCVDVVRETPDAAVDFSVFSPPFASLYTYTNSPRDMGNVTDHEAFAAHFGFLIPELLRITKPGRLCAVHCMNLPTSKVRDGVIGLRDFRGDIIRAFAAAGWVYHSEVCIWKDPVTAMQRTKALGLLYKTLKKDSAMSRQGIPDYLVVFRAPGENPEPVSHTPEGFPVGLWQRYASPVWMDINPSDTLQYRSAREHEDERHICPLQLDVIRRAIRLWTNPGDLVFSPFAGIGSEGHVAREEGRRFLGAELKPSYWRQACANLTTASRPAAVDLFATVA